MATASRTGSSVGKQQDECAPRHEGRNGVDEEEGQCRDGFDGMDRPTERAADGAGDLDQHRQEDQRHQGDHRHGTKPPAEHGEVGDRARVQHLANSCATVPVASVERQKDHRGHEQPQQVVVDVGPHEAR